MRSIERHAIVGRAWFLNSGTRVLTAVNRTALIYMRNLDSQRKLAIADVFLGGSQAAHWALYVYPTQDTEGALSNHLTPQNMDLSWLETRGAEGDVNVVTRGGDDGDLQVGGTVVLHWWTRAYETLRIPFDGALKLGHRDTLAFNCEPNVNGTFSATLEFWQHQEGPEAGSPW